MEGIILNDPLEKTVKSIPEEDPWRIKDFKNFLYVYNSSHLTIKNYIMDIKQFLSWAESSTGVKDAWELKEKNVLSKIDENLIKEYKNRLFEAGLSPVTVNRKLSSLRKYISWLKQEGIIKIKDSNFHIQNFQKPDAPNISSLREFQNFGEKPLLLPSPKILADEIASSETYSRIPPIRLLQKAYKGLDYIFDQTAISPLARILEEVQVLFWKAKGEPVFIDTNGRKTKKDPTQVPNFTKSFYAPLSVSLKNHPPHKKVMFHLVHTGPNLYRRYQLSPVAAYFNFVILIIFSAAIVFGLYKNFIVDPQNQKKALATPISPLKVMSFQGKLTDASNNPITSSKKVRFIIYNSQTASSSARRWEEVDTITPDSDGVFSVLLGSNGSGGNASTCNGEAPPGNPATGACGIPQSLFAGNTSLWLGITIETDSELTPRQQLATVAYATNAEVLQGLPPTTDSNWISGNTNTNAVLALSSNGTLAIGGASTTTFQATGGRFKLSGKPLRLETNAGTGGNIELFPDGLGKIDVQKGLVNTTSNGNILSGAVEILDNFDVLATDSANSAFIVNNNGVGGDIMTASSSGITQFVINSNGYLGVGVASPTERFDISGNATISGNLTFDGARTIAARANNPLFIGDDQTGNLIFTTATGNKISFNNDSTFIDSLGNLNIQGYATATASLSVGTFNAPAGPGNAVFSGKLGVGTASPTSIMEISGAS
ncbi:site-specific integrase, partial [Patescibacteria group bacterium]|nr:site-specific integrase [Patescibacteria group bacterium]